MQPDRLTQRQDGPAPILEIVSAGEDGPFDAEARWIVER